MFDLSENLRIAIEASIDAGIAILDVYNRPDFNKELKEDKSPLTEADLTANSIINSFLEKTIYPIISEENKNEDFTIRKNWEYCWIVDPLDGTKEFIKKNGEFTVNIALVINGIPEIGVIYVPVTRELYYASVTNKKAYKTQLDPLHNINGNLFNASDRINPNQKVKNKLRIVGSRSHMNQDTLDFIEKKKEDFETIEIVSKGSSLKFCLVAEGKADIYPRFAPTMEWDTAAGQAICMAAGFNVISKETGENLSYNKKNLLNPYFEVR
ncbi:3'(2'),5'-bisphosphate nucleotidase CysQ [Aurantibacter sp.]|uniref:3'(2'),5'-bisphosphate nucleotidase CysQ n=1 Tax=Aurantibacter sp. TaxID=2807103 RepID=UPI00326477F3